MSDHMGFGQQEVQLRLFDPGPPTFGFDTSDLSGSEFWKPTSTSAETLTPELLEKAINAVKSYSQPDPCKLGHHLVSPSGKSILEAGGRAMCHSCGVILGPYN